MIVALDALTGLACLTLRDMESAGRSALLSIPITAVVGVSGAAS